MRANRHISIIMLAIMSVTMCGCASLISKTPNDVVILPDERIYTVPANQEIDFMLDGKPQKVAFPTDMKLVSSTVLVRQEMRLNEEMLKAQKMQKDADKKLKLWGSILALLATLGGVFISAKKWIPKVNLSVK